MGEYVWGLTQGPPHYLRVALTFPECCPVHQSPDIEGGTLLGQRPQQKICLAGEL